MSNARGEHGKQAPDVGLTGLIDAQLPRALDSSGDTIGQHTQTVGGTALVPAFGRWPRSLCVSVVLTRRIEEVGAMDNGTRDRVLGRLAEATESVTTAHPVRVAVDGPPAAGKTTLADELAVVLRDRDREVIRSSIEGFLLPRVQRYRRGEDSPEGCYHDSFDFHALHRVLLDPLGPDGDRTFQQAVYDRDTDTALSPPVTTAAADAVLLGLPSSTTSTRSGRPISPTSSCTTTSPSSPPGTSDHADRWHPITTRTPRQRSGAST